MISTFLGVQGDGAAALRERATSLGADLLIDDPGFLVLGARGSVSVQLDSDLACVLWGSPGVLHLPPSVGDETETVTQRVSAAYRMRGSLALSLLRPPFAVVLWDRGEGTGLVATDQLGARSVFTTRLGRGIAFSGEIADLLSILDTRPIPDLSVLGSWLAVRGVPRERTLYAGIDRLPGGSLLALGHATARVRQYDSRPPPDTLDASPEELAGMVRAEVQRAVGSRIPPGATAGVFLSGGIDSTSVAAAAVRAAGRDRTIAISAVFPGRPDADESALISAVVAKLGLRAEQRAVDVGAVFAHTVDFLTRWQVPAESPTFGFQLALQGLAADAGADLVLDGEGGDELFGLRPYLIADSLRRGRLLHAWRLATGLGGDPRTARRALSTFGVRGAIPSWVHGLRGAGAPSWLRKDIAVELPAATRSYAWKALDGPRWLAEGRDQLTRQRERIGAHDYLRRRATMTGSVAAHPFLDDLDLIELALRLPPEQGFYSTNDRPVLRAAMEGELPDAVRLRLGKSFFNHLIDESLNGVERPTLEALLGPGAEISSVVSPAFLEALLATPLERRRGTWTWTAWRMASAEYWLRFQGDQGLAFR